MSFKIVIPARWASERLPGKPLRDIAGRPMILRTLDQAREAGADEVVVAVDDARIAEIVTKDGGQVEMTRSDHVSGTDRISECATRRGWEPETVVVNLQGDEPLTPPRLLTNLASALLERPDCGLATLAAPIRSSDELFSEHSVKVVLDDRSRAHYFSRAPIPWVRGAMDPAGPLPDGRFLRHLGMYAYRVSTLEQISLAPPSPLERLERLEQLRALDMGISIHVNVLDEAPPAGVDVASDIERLESLLRE